MDDSGRRIRFNLKDMPHLDYGIRNYELKRLTFLIRYQRTL
jgi:hypothetical protein